MKKLEEVLSKATTVCSTRKLIKSKDPVPLYCMTGPDPKIKFSVWSDTPKEEIEAFALLITSATCRHYTQAAADYKGIKRGLHT